LKKLIVLLVGVGAALAAVWLWQVLFPNNETQIRRLLDDVAESASLKANTHPLVRLGGANKLADFFTSDVVIDLEGASIPVRSMNGREELVQAVTAARASVQEVKVGFHDVQITVDPDGISAAAHLTALANVTGTTDPYVQETRMRLVKNADGWRISKVAPVKTPRLE